MNLPSTETPQLPLPSHPDRRGWGAPGLTANSPPQQWTLIFPKVSRKKTGIWEVKEKRVGAAGQARTTPTVAEVSDTHGFLKLQVIVKRW